MSQPSWSASLLSCSRFLYFLVATLASPHTASSQVSPWVSTNLQLVLQHVPQHRHHCPKPQPKDEHPHHPLCRVHHLLLSTLCCPVYQGQSDPHVSHRVNWGWDDDVIIWFWLTALFYLFFLKTESEVELSPTRLRGLKTPALSSSQEVQGLGSWEAQGQQHWSLTRRGEGSGFDFFKIILGS